MQAKFKSLLAARIVKMMLNTDSSRLNVTASLSVADKENLSIAELFPTRGLKKESGQPKSAIADAVISPDSGKFPLGTAVQLRIANNETSDLYISVLVIDPTGEMTIIYPYQWTAAKEVARVGAGQAIAILDRREDSFELRTQEPKGVTEVLIIASETAGVGFSSG